MREFLEEEVGREPVVNDLGAEGQGPKVEFRVVKLEAEEPDVVRKRNGLHAGRLATGGTQRKGKHGRKGWSNFS